MFMSNIQRSLTVTLFLFLTVSLVSLYGAAGSSSDAAVKNIETFTRLYGYVKYFYPGDEAAETDWDRFAVYGVKRVEKAGSRAELKKTLEELFLPIAPTLVIHESGQKAGFSLAGITPPDPKGMKVVAWQHFGAGNNTSRSIYRSVRINKITKLSTKDDFGTISCRIDAEPYRGKDIKLKAAVKVKKGRGLLWLRVDREGNARGFFDNMEDRPIKPGQWNHYEIKGTVAGDAVKINFGCLLRGEGKLWTDDFQLYVKEKQGDQWEPVTVKNPGFEADKENVKPGEWSTPNPGYLYLVTSETAAKGSKSLSIENRTEEISDPLFDRKPGIGEYIAKDLGSGLSCVMPIALYSTETQTFPRAPETALKQLKAAIEKEVAKDLSVDDVYVRLADIVIAWNVFRHFYPYFDVLKIDWPASLPKALTSAYRDKNAKDFLKTLQKFTAGLNDGHVYVSLQGDKSNTYYPPIKWEWIEEQLVITGLYDKSLPNLRIGDVVVEIDGVTAEKAIVEKEQYVSAGTDRRRRYRALVTLAAGAKDSPIPLKINREGTFVNETVTRTVDMNKYYAFYAERAVKSKKIAEGIYYLNLDKIPWKEIEQLMPELEKAKSIICDLRGYPKGNHQLISHLLKEEDKSKWMFVPQVIYPDYEKVTFQEYGWNMKPIKPTLTAKVIFIINHRPISYAESYLGFIDHYKLATIIGQPSAGTNGNVNYFVLPGGFRIRWTGMKVLKQDGSQLHGIGFIPHIRLKRTIKGIKEGRDEFLEKAIELAKE